MKKRILAVCLLLSLLLTGCGAAQEAAVTTAPTTVPYDPDEDGTTSPVISVPDPTAPVGAILEVPDAAAHPDSLGLYEEYRLDVIDMMGLRYTYAYRYTFATDATEYYIKDEYNDEETVWYIHREDQEQYVRGLGEEEFIRNTYWGTDTSGANIEDFTVGMDIFLGYYAPEEDIHYVKMEDVDALTGPACAYEVYYKNQLDCYILIDKESGFLVQKFDANMTVMLLVTSLDLTTSNIPDYK